jgi:hypothetical protein
MDSLSVAIALLVEGDGPLWTIQRRYTLCSSPPSAPVSGASQQGLITTSDPRDHDADPADHDGPIHVITMPIRLITVDRSG